MRILITGGQSRLAQVAAEALSNAHEVRSAGAADLRQPEAVAPLVAGMDAILHLDPYAELPDTDPAVTGVLLDHAGSGTYVPLHAALAARVPRVVLVSRLSLLEPYGDAVIDETWEPQPGTDAAYLVPYLAELTVREFVRAEELLGICLRLGDLGPDGTTEADALSALTRALTMDPGANRHRWLLYHVESAGRFPSATAAREPFCWTPAAAGSR